MALSLFPINQADTRVVQRPVTKDVLSLVLSLMMLQRVLHIKIFKITLMLPFQMEEFSNAHLFQAQLKTNT